MAVINKIRFRVEIISGRGIPDFHIRWDIGHLGNKKVAPMFFESEKM